MTGWQRRARAVTLTTVWVVSTLAARVSSTVAQPVLIETREGFQARSVFEQGLADFDEGQQIQATDPDRARRLFRSAAQRFESIAAKGPQDGGLLRLAAPHDVGSGDPTYKDGSGASVVSGRLAFNLGNCYLQAGDLGRAILHYRRALRLIPRDELLKGNLKVARARCLTTIRQTRRSAFVRSAFFWHYETSVPERTRAAIFLYVAFWVLLSVRTFARHRVLLVAIIACAIVTAALGLSAAADGWLDRSAPDGVVIAMDVVVHKGPGTGYQRRFEQPLQPGVEFTLRQRRGSWWEVELPDGQTGWVEAATSELIPNAGASR